MIFVVMQILISLFTSSNQNKISQFINETKMSLKSTRRAKNLVGNQVQFGLNP